MPGAIGNPLVNPEQAWMDYHPNQDVEIYRGAIRKGFKYGGADSWDMSGADQSAMPQYNMKLGGTTGKSVPGPGQSGGPTQAGGGFGGASSSSEWWSKGGAPGLDARKAAWRSDMQRMRKEGNMRREDDLAMRGVKNAGTGAFLSQMDQDKWDIEEARGTEQMESDFYNQQMAFDLEQKRIDADNARSMWSGGPQTFEGQNHGGGGGGGGGGGAYSSKQKSDEYSELSQPSETGGASGGKDALGDDPRGKGAMEMARWYYRATGKYGTPTEHEWLARQWYGRG